MQANPSGHPTVTRVRVMECSPGRQQVACLTARFRAMCSPQLNANELLSGVWANREGRTENVSEVKAFTGAADLESQLLVERRELPGGLELAVHRDVSGSSIVLHAAGDQSLGNPIVLIGGTDGDRGEPDEAEHNAG